MPDVSIKYDCLERVDRIVCFVYIYDAPTHDQFTSVNTN